MEVIINKFCNKEYNLALECNTIQLGTLKYYRELDPDFSIADEKEGINQAFTSGNPVVFRNDEMLATGLVTGNSVKGEMIIRKGFTINSHNVYIFSASLNDQNEFWNEYNSKYTIYNVYEFIQLINRALVANFKLSDLEITDLSLVQMNNLRFHIVAKPVEYLKKPFDFNDKNKFDTISKINNPIENIFYKSSDFENENEFRIAFIPMVGNEIFSVKKTPKILNLNPLKDYVAYNTI